jgi:hypothetical protein
VLRALRDFYVINVGPERVGLPGAGWKVALLCSGTTALSWLHGRYSLSASTMASSR